MGPGSTSVIQVTNVAPTVTNEQLRTLLAFIGTIREFVVYPSNDPSQQMSRVCYVKYTDPMSVCVAQHLTSTVFLDRAIYVKAVADGRIPDEILALKLANEGHSQNSSNSGVVSQIANVNGTQSITTIDPRLNALGLPQYPPLPASLDPSKIEEIRRTVSVSNVPQYTTPEELLEFFNQFGEIKYLRMTASEGDVIKSALIEFTDQSSVANALQSTGSTLKGAPLSINHSTTSILKPPHSVTDKLEKNENRDLKTKAKDSRSPLVQHSHRSRTPTRKSRSPQRSGRRRSASRSRSPRERRRRSRSRERRRSVDRRRSRSPSYSKDRNRDSRSRRGRERERSKERDRNRGSREISERRRSRDRERRRDSSRECRSKDRDRERNRRRDRERSRESDRKERHRSRRDKDNRHERDHSRSRSKSKNISDKRENSGMPGPDSKAVEMDIDIEDKKDDFSVKSMEDSNSQKSISPLP